MNILVKLASGFMNLFTLGGEQFVSWVSPDVVIINECDHRISR